MSAAELQAAALMSLGPAIGVFLGVLIGLGVVARGRRPGWLYRDSLYATALIGSALAFFVSFVIRVFFA